MLRKIIASLAAASLLLVSVSFAEDAVHGILGKLSFFDQANAATSTQAVVLSTSVQATITLTVASSTLALGSLTPGTPIFTTSSSSVATNNATGITFQVNRNSATSTLVHSDTVTTFPDATAWNGSNNATTTNVVGANLHFKVASTTTDVGLYSTSFWGPDDTDGTTHAKYAGFPTTAQTIASNAGYVSANQNIVTRYRLDAPATQKTGTYTGTITYTAFTNP